MIWKLLGAVSSSALYASLFATAAAAQNTDGPPADATSAETTRPSASSDSGIADIVVTASRRPENVQRSALSVQAFSSATLAKANVTKPEDLNAIAPGVSIGTGGNYPQVYIRGVGNFAANTLAEGAVAFNFDGVYISRAPSTRGMFFDLDRIEVLKGPQGTLYGRNATGGAINVITAKPRLDEISGYAEVGVGNYSLVQGEAALNLPLGPTAALRVSGQVVDRHGYLSDGSDDEKTRSARLQLLWEPVETVSVVLSSNYQHVGGRGVGPVLTPQLPGDDFRAGSDPAVVAIIRAQPGLGPFLSVPATDNRVDFTTYTIGGELNWDLGAATFTLLPAFRYSDLRDIGYVPGFYLERNDVNKQTSVEARLGHSSDTIKWVLGGYYFNEEQSVPNGLNQSVTDQGIAYTVIPEHRFNTRSYAAFGQATLSLSDRFRATGGLRYTYERKILAELLTSYNFPLRPPAPPGSCAAGSFDPTTPRPPLFCLVIVDSRDNPQRESFENVTFKAGVEFDAAPQSLLYANVSTGFKSGGFFPAPEPNSFKPEKLTAFDIGSKNRFFNNSLQVNVEAFYWQYRDHQETSVGPTSIPDFFSLLTYNAGRAKSYGGEIDIRYRPSPRDELSFTLQYNKTKYDSFVYSYQTSSLGPPVTGCAVGPLNVVTGAQQIDCTGKPLMRAPVWTGTAGATHDFDLGEYGTLTIGGQVQFSSSYFLSTDFLEAGRQDAFAVGNIDLTYATVSRRVTVSAFVRNVLDEAVYTQAFRYPYVFPGNPLANSDGVFFGTLRPPRTFGGKVRVNF